MNRNDCQEMIDAMLRDCPKLNIRIDPDPSHDFVDARIRLDVKMADGVVVTVGHLQPNGMRWHHIYLIDDAVRRSYHLGCTAGKSQAVQAISDNLYTVAGVKKPRTDN